ncbi:MAG: Fis family transcriptional regulator [Francisellaceae bacterium]|nr:Fis family transcriptional regulator [Francisellaceae bacterium]
MAENFLALPSSLYSPNHTLKEHVKHTLHRYFEKLEGEPAANLLSLVLSEVEKPLLETVLHYTKGNEKKAALWLGIHRTTLRNLLIKHKIKLQKKKRVAPL